MQTQPEIHGVDHATKPVFFVGPAYDVTVATIKQTPDRHQYLYLLIVFPHRSAAESDEPCLYVCSERTEGANYALAIFDDAGHRILEKERGDWTDFGAFTKRALEIASEQLAARFVEFQSHDWKYKKICNPTEDVLNGLISEGWIRVDSGMGLDGDNWLLLKKPKTMVSNAA